MSNSATSQIRIVKKKKSHSSHHGGAWKVAYADFVTAMMAFFLVMWITGMSSAIKSAVAGYFRDPSAFMQQIKTGNALFTVTESPQGGISNKTDRAAVENERKQLKGAKEQIQRLISKEFAKLKSAIDIKLVREGLRIDLLEGKESLFFDSASAQVKPSTKRLLTLMTVELRKLPNKLILEGHTDSRPLAREYGYTNWELSANRANAARQIMAAAGLPDSQIVQVRGYAATQPRDPKHPEHYSNRRVSIIVVMSDVLQQQMSMGEQVDPSVSITPAQ